MKEMVRRDFCFKIKGITDVFAPNKIIDGYVRPYGEPHMWISENITKDNEWIELQWENNIDINEIHVTFNDNVNEDLINLHHHHTDFPVIPELIKNYKIEVYKDNKWEIIISKKNNRERNAIFKNINKMSVCKLRINIEATNANGSKRAELVEVRVY
ncbi:hypothetical protein [Clostridium frigoris]|uniref:hypothetical protein n=1 Tax=Clostridium frigoris TaxID=205327 RepID=UPI001FE52138|nr:hypothetical protein [Clostridium frigoris]